MSLWFWGWGTGGLASSGAGAMVCEVSDIGWAGYCACLFFLILMGGVICW